MCEDRKGIFHNRDNERLEWLEWLPRHDSRRWFKSRQIQGFFFFEFQVVHILFITTHLIEKNNYHK